MIDVLLTTLLLAAITGWAVTWRDLKRENARLFAAAVLAAQQCNVLRIVNRQLGQEMKAAGLDVVLVGCGEPGCENCAEEWPKELEIER